MIKRTLEKFRTLLVFSFAGLLSLTFSSCEKDGEGENEIQVEGIYIVNEGQLKNNNGSITLMDPEKGNVVNNYFASKNNDRSPGDIIQDLSFSTDKGYIVVNNSQKLVIVDKENFKQSDFIDISYPRQFLAINQDKGYLTNGSSGDGSKGEVLIVDLNNHTISDTIKVGKGPEYMVKADNKVFVSNSGGWSSDSTVSVIDVSSDEVIENVEVENTPRDMVKDKYDNIWVFCNGPWVQNEGFTNSKLVKINTSSDYQTRTFDIGKISTNGNYLLATGADKEMLYFVGEKGIYEMNISDSNAPDEPIIDRIPYGLDVNPENGNIYCMMSNRDTKGYLLRFNEEHGLKDSTQVGYNPNAVVFE